MKSHIFYGYAAINSLLYYYELFSCTWAARQIDHEGTNVSGCNAIGIIIWAMTTNIPALDINGMQLDSDKCTYIYIHTYITSTLPDQGGFSVTGYIRANQGRL